MLVFWQPRLVFLATPKTGTTAIEAALEPLSVMSVLRPPALKHTPASRYQKHLRPFLEKPSGARFTCVAQMREPVDWLRSWYRFRRREAVEATDRSTAEMSFEDFVEGYLADPRPTFANVGQQSRFLSHNGKLAVDHLFRYEDMDALLAFLEDRLGCALTLPVVNISPPGETTLPAPLAERLRREMAPDLDLYARIPPGGALAGDL